MLKKFICIGLLALGVCSWAGDRVETKHFSFDRPRKSKCPATLDVDYPVSGPQNVLTALKEKIGPLNKLKYFYKEIDCDMYSRLNESISVEDKGSYVLMVHYQEFNSGNNHIWASTSVILKPSGIIIEDPFVVPKTALIDLIESKVDEELIEMCRNDNPEWNFRENVESIAEDMKFTIDEGHFALRWEPSVFCYCGEECDVSISFTKNEIKPYINKSLFDVLE